MFEVTVTRLKDGKKATAQASSESILRDHLEASAARNGFTVELDHNESWLLGYSVGEVLKGGKIVASFEIGEIK
jgi:hypothetical protein